MNTHSIFNSSLANDLSIFPVVQQVIGLGTIIDAIIHIWKIHQEMQNSDNELDKEAKDTLASHNGVNKIKRTFHNKSLKSNRSQEQAKEKIKEYENQILVGLIRMTPIVGSVYSTHKWSQTL